MKQSANAKPTFQPVAESLPNDNRSPEVRYLDDIQALARMASITHNMIEEAHYIGRAVKCEDSIYTFHFSEDTLEDINFAAADVMRRAALLLANRRIIEEAVYERAAQ